MTTDKNPTLRHAGRAVATALAFALLAGCAADGSKSAPNMLSEDGKKDRERALSEAASSGKPQVYRVLTFRPVPQAPTQPGWECVEVSSTASGVTDHEFITFCKDAAGIWREAPAQGR